MRTNPAVKLYTDRAQPSIQPAFSPPQKLTFAAVRASVDCIRVISITGRSAQKAL
jgi:hypothetical protein